MNSIGTNPVSSNGSIDGGNSGTGGSTSSNATYTTDLVNIDSSVPSDIGLIPTLNTNTTITEAEFRVRNSNYRNRWGYSLNGLTVSSNTDSSTGEVTNTITENTDTSTISYHDIPANSEQRMIDEKETESDKGLTPITIGVNATSGLASGTYKNTLEFTAIANPIPVEYSLAFNQNTTDTVFDMPTENPITESSVAGSVTFTIPDYSPNRVGYKFKGWNTAADGSGDTYNMGESYQIMLDDTKPSSSKATLYAIWAKLYNYNITYSCNSGSSCPANSTFVAEETSYEYNIPSTLPTRQGYRFTGYSGSDGKTYQANSTILLDSTNPNIALSAEWQLITYVIGGKTWTGVMGRATFANAQSLCPSGYHVPTKVEFQNLIGATDTNWYGTNAANIIAAIGYWGDGWEMSSTSNSNNQARAWGLYLTSDDMSGMVRDNFIVKDSWSTNVVCAKN